MKSVYRWNGYDGRDGEIKGVFVATEQEIDRAIGKDACLGEVLGKHSEVSLEIRKKDFEILAASEEVAAFVEEYGPFGFDPLAYVACETCGENLETDDDWAAGFHPGCVTPLEEYDDE